MRVIFLVVAISAAFGVSAQIYTWTDAAGRVHYGDEPPRGSTARYVGESELPHVHQQQPPRPVARQQAPQRGPTVSVIERQPAKSLAECQRVKRQAVAAGSNNRRKGAEELDSWLWKHCRQYSNELRTISQQMM